MDSQQAQQDNLLCLFLYYLYEHPLPLPLGEVAERSEDGEGKQWPCQMDFRGVCIQIDLAIQKRVHAPLSHLR